MEVRLRLVISMNMHVGNKIIDIDGGPSRWGCSSNLKGLNNYARTGGAGGAGGAQRVPHRPMPRTARTSQGLFTHTAAAEPSRWAHTAWQSER